jgi:hypothetical protein
MYIGQNEKWTLIGIEPRIPRSKDRRRRASLYIAMYRKCTESVHGDVQRSPPATEALNYRGDLCLVAVS